MLPNNNTIKTKIEKIGKLYVLSPSTIIDNNDGTPIMLTNTLEDFVSDII